MKSRLLSSRSTAWFKYFVAPVFGFVAILAICAIVWWRIPVTTAPLLGLLLWLGLVGVMLWRASGWKRVELEQDALLISGFRTKDRVPLDAIGEVRDQRWFLRTIVVRLRRAGPFGSVVSFKPHLSLALWREHPVVAELRHAVAMGKVSPAELIAAQGQDRRRMWLIVGAVGIFFLVFSVFVELMLRRSAAFQLGLETLRNNPEVRQALGQPIEPGLLIGGQLLESPDRGCAALDYVVQGPHGTGHAYTRAVKTAGGWHLARLWVEMESGAQRIEAVGATSLEDSACGE